jgi:hypothetical protein
MGLPAVVLTAELFFDSCNNCKTGFHAFVDRRKSREFAKGHGGLCSSPSLSTRELP